MTSTPQAPVPAAGDLRKVHDTLRRLERRDWWLWATAIAVILLLTGGVAALSLSEFLGGPSTLLGFTAGQATLALALLVGLFSFYALYQQSLIKGLRRQLSEQIDLLTRLGLQAGELRQMALLDPLTDLFNRRYAEQQLRTEIARADRNKDQLTLLMLDLNNLKEINDSYGHPAGDAALREFATRLRRAVRNSDLPARTGGDEFLVVLPECPPELVPHLLTRISGIEMDFGKGKIPVRFSAGWVGYEPGEAPEDFLQRADQALYLDKRTNKVEEQIRQAQAQLRQSQKMEAVGRLAGGVAHDFNNLLMLIKGYSELVLERLPGDHPSRRHLDEITKAADRASALTRQLLAFSRRQVLQPRVLNLNTTVSDIESMLRRLIGENIELHTELDPALVWVRADPGQLEQVILNLAVNARDAMPNGGRLTLRTHNFLMDDDFASSHRGSRPGPYAVLCVADNGCGMDAETQAHIFEPFFTTRGRDGGTGLGLATVYGIVKQSGGYIWVDSELQRGTTFTIYLPQSEAERERPAPAEPEVVGASSGTVLVVEDETALRQLARQFLEAQGYTVLEAGDGNEALQVARTHGGAIDLLMTDVVMPGMGGRELAEKLLTERPGLKVLYVSGYTDDAAAHAGPNSSKSAFLQKPFSRETLARTLREMLGAGQEARPAGPGR